MRNALARTLHALAREDERVCVVVADISPAGAMEDLRREMPDRFVNVGVAEQSMIGLAAGMAMRGLRPFCYTIATFALFRAYEFIRCDLAYQRLPVTVVGMGAGLSYSTLGGTHQAVEDVAVAMACPGMAAVLAPSDPLEVEACARWCASRGEGGPVYMRIGKAGEPEISGQSDPWEFGRLRWVLRTGPMVKRCILAYGSMVATALEVGQWLGGAAVAAVPTLRPLPAEQIAKVFTEYEEVVVIEEASGGPLSIRVAALAHERGYRGEVVPVALAGDFVHFYGGRDELLDHVGMSPGAIIAKVKRAKLAKVGGTRQ